MLNIELVAAETGSNVAVHLCICCEIQRENIMFQEMWEPNHNLKTLNIHSAVLFLVVLSGLCSGIHTLHPEIVGYYQAVNLELSLVPNKFACLIQFK